MTLTDAHRAYLNAHAITDETIEAAGIRSGKWIGDPAIILTWRDLSGREVNQAIMPEKPKADRYRFPSKEKAGSPPLNHLRAAANGGPRLLVEGTKQSHAALSWAHPAWGVVGMNGCNGWHGQDLSGFKGSDVAVIFDKDVTTNRRVHDAATEIHAALTEIGAKVRFPVLDGEGTDGLDDVLAKIDKSDRQRYLVKLVNETTPGVVPEFVGDDDETDGTTRDGRTKVNVGNRERAGRWLRGQIGRGPLAGLFHRDGELVFTPRMSEAGYVPPEETGSDDGPAQVRIMSETELKTTVEIRYAPGVGKVQKNEETGETSKEWEARTFPRESATHAHTAARMRDGVPNLRKLAGVTHTPLMRPDGTVLDTPGYDAGTSLLYLPDSGLTVPAVSDEPTPDEIAAAVELIKSIVAEFPFVEDHHRANWFGALFTPILRAVFPPPYPVMIIDAPDKGSGKSYLASALRTVHGGILRAGFPENDAELSKEILGILMGTTAPVITLDNVRGKIKSAKFEALLTSPTFSARLLGVNREGTAPNDRLWTITANNAEIDGDLARRSYWITIDPKTPRPFERTGFKLDLPTWLPANRGKIIHALLTISRGWTRAGAPSAVRKRSDDYATWDAALEGLLSWAGFPGQFGKPDAAHMEGAEDQEWELFITTARLVMGEKPFKMADLVAKIGTGADGDPFTDTPTKIDPELLPGDLAAKWGREATRAGITRSLGAWFGYRAGRYVGDLVVRIKKDPKKGNVFRIERWAE